jgi:hypothetical protein
MSPETNCNLEFDKTPTKRTLEKHTVEALATVEKVARAFNPSADESKIQAVIRNTIKNLSETTEEHKALDDSILRR